MTAVEHRHAIGAATGVVGAVPTVVAALLVPAGLILTTVGRLGYLQCALLVIAAVYAVRDVGEVARVAAAHGRTVLLSVLGGVEVLMAASAAPASTVVVGLAGGLLVGVAAWVPGRRGVRAGLVAPEGGT